jgi:mannose-P-dolichol utilization defect 1
MITSYCFVFLLFGSLLMSHAFQKRPLIVSKHSLRSPKLNGSAKSYASQIIGSASNKIQLSQVIAKALGYTMGAGALALYVPIIVKLKKEGDADGMSLQTWIFNILGFTSGVMYPLKMGFPFSTYVDGFVLTAQSIIVMGLTCLYRNLFTEYLLGILAYSAVVAGILYANVPQQFFIGFQIASIIMCNYANLPQIALGIKTRKASWSWITAAMSTIGNGIKMYTTSQLTQDKIIFGGHIVGFATNAILLAQTLMLGKNR